MEQIDIPSQILADFIHALNKYNPLIGSFCGELSTKRGVIIKTTTGSLFLDYKSILNNIWETHSEDQLRSVASNFMVHN